MSTSSEPLAGRSGGSVFRALYLRYAVVIVVLLGLVGAVQYQSLHRALLIAGENSLVIALKDALEHPSVLGKLTPQGFRADTPQLMSQLSARGINVRLYDNQMRLISHAVSRYDPVDLVSLTARIARLTGRKQTAANLPTGLMNGLHAYTMESQGQILLFARIGPSAHPVGYVELGYEERMIYPILRDQAVQFFAVSVLILLLASALLLPVVSAPLKPLRLLARTAERIRAGAFQERLPLIGSSETVQLASVINDALDQLAAAMQKESQAAKKMKEFVSAASHELRTPLTAVSGFTDVLLRRIGLYEEEAALIQRSLADGEDLSVPALRRALLDTDKLESIRKGMETIQQETGRLHALVRDLLQLARLDEGLQPNRERVNLADIVRDLQPQLSVLSRGRSIVYRLADVTVECDRSMVGQIIYNLVMNAIQYTPPGHGRIWVHVAQAGDGKARLSVRDNGVGIEESQLGRIFDRFYRASGARDRDPGGSGLGLSIVAAIAQAHGGTAWAESKPGEGATIIVEL